MTGASINGACMVHVKMVHRMSGGGPGAGHGGDVGYFAKRTWICSANCTCDVLREARLERYPSMRWVEG